MQTTHYVRISAAIVIAGIGAYLANGGTPLVVGGVSLLAMLVSIANIFVQSPADMTAAKLAAKRPGSAGFVSARALFAVVAFGAVAVVGFVRCSALTPQQTGTDVTIGVNAAACVLTNGAADIASGMSLMQTVTDLVKKCDVAVAQIAQIFDAQGAAADKLGDTNVASASHSLAAAARQQDGGSP